MLTALTAWLVLGEAWSGHLDLSDRAQLSSRPPTVAETRPVDAENTAAAALALLWPRLQLGLGYGWQYTQQNAWDQSAASTLMLHTGFLNLSSGPPRFRVSLGGSGSLGTQSFARLAVAPPPGGRADPGSARVDFLPPGNESIQTAAASASAGFAAQWTRRLRSDVSAAYAVTGGRESGLAILPRQRSTSAAAGVTYALSLTDRAGGTLQAVQTSTSNGLRYQGVGATVGWSRQLGTATGVQAAAGALVGVQRQAGSPDSRHTLEGLASGSLSALLVRERGLLMTLLTGAAVAPQVTSLTGARQQRVQGSVTLTAVVFRKTTVTATGDAIQTLPLDSPEEARILGLGLSVGHRLAEPLDVIAGYRAAWQQSRDPLIGSPPPQWFAYAGLAIRAPSLKF